MKFLNILAICALAITVTACSSNTDSDSGEEGSKLIHKGYLTDSALAGVTYECDGKTGLTGLDGLFECSALPVVFKLGNITLGALNTIPEDLKVFPQDILDIPRTDLNDARLVAIIRFLQSLDDDGQYDDVINILEAVREVLEKEDAMELAMLSPSALEALVVKAGHELVSAEIALAHLQATLDKQPDQCNVISNHKVSAEQGQQIRIYVYSDGTDDIQVDNPENGTANIYNVGSEEVNVVYTSDSDFEGVDRFEYTVDGCTRSIAVAVIKDCSFVSDVNQTTAINSSVTFPLIENHNYESYSLNTPENGSVGWVGVNGVTLIADYSPNKDFHGEDTFDFTINGCTRTATITVTPPQLVVPFYDADHGWEPWVTDGSASGTNMVADVIPGESGSVNVPMYSAFFPFVKQGDFYYYYEDRDIYVATKDSAQLLKAGVSNMAGGSIIAGPDEYVYFLADVGTEGTNLWRSDGTVAGTTLVFDSQPDNDFNSITSSPVTIFNNQLYFISAAQYGVTEYIYKSNGTNSGTSEFLDVKEFNTSLYATESQLFFNDDDGYPWFTDGVDGTAAHTKQLTTSVTAAREFVQVGSTTYFAAVTSGVNSGRHGLYKTNGQVGNIESIKDFPQRSAYGLMACHNKLYLQVYQGRSLYVSDGTTAGTVYASAMNDVLAGPNDGGDRNITNFNGLNCIDDVLYITAENSSDQKNLYSLNSAGQKTVVSSDNSREIQLMPETVDGKIIYSTQKNGDIKLWAYSATQGNVLLKHSLLAE